MDDYLRTSAPHIFAAGDVTGRLMLVPPAIQDGFVAATNAVLGSTVRLEQREYDRRIHGSGACVRGPDGSKGP